MPRSWRSGTIATSGPDASSACATSGAQQLRRDMRDVDREDQDRVGIRGDRFVAGFAETVVQAAAPLSHRSRALPKGELANLVVGGDDDRLVDAGGGHGGADRAARQAEREVASLFRIEDGAEARLRAVDRADRDDRDDHEIATVPANRRTSPASLARPRRRS